MNKNDLETILSTAFSVAIGLYLIDAIIGERKPTREIEKENEKIREEAIRRTNKVMLRNIGLLTS